MHSLFRRAKAPPAAAAAPAPMPMLSFPGKKALRFTGDTSAAERDTDLAKLLLARAHVVALAASDGISGKKRQAASAAEAAAALRAYIRIVYAAEMNGASSHQLLRFAWRDDAGESSSNNKKASRASSAVESQSGHASLATEHAVALFALAAELARAAAEEDRRGVDGVRRACAALADAAGALGAAAVKVRRAADGPEGGGLCHMTDACLAALERLMLVQAHECYFELALAGGKAAALCAKIARQVSLDYQQVSIALESLQQHQPIDKSWAPHAQAKAFYFHGEACLLHARALLEQGAGRVGEAVARLRFALSPAVLDGAGSKAAIKKSAAPVREAAAALRREVEAELAAAERDNCQVFFERVPPADALPALPGLAQPLVRPSTEESVLREADGEPPSARGGAPTTARH
ncbi:hypothetical protein PR202_gb07067 [Eleusine coracana subsp. coracana]|uniref:BRO1 domain-containing protein n=1 Tax=Eleusine coracana subsp. coracana TaxID=191504 RepID=A0AAV5EAJ2_ELECO|nr:hypothetical protein QOZ80_2BG0165680 [Eleusine coracana subsp. coracana]GJN19758.1 hypothetical protein PR202_gb07067 [Eleusine coracana subsp. coracana]